MRQKDWNDIGRSKFMEDENLPVRKGKRPQRVPPKEPKDYTDTGVMEHEREKREFDAFEKRYPGLRKLLKKHGKGAK